MAISIVKKEVKKVYTMGYRQSSCNEYVRFAVIEGFNIELGMIFYNISSMVNRVELEKAKKTKSEKKVISFLESNIQVIKEVYSHLFQ